MKSQQALATILDLLLAGSLPPADIAALGAHLGSITDDHMAALADIFEAGSAGRPYDASVLSDEDVAFLNRLARVIPMPGAPATFTR
jgi:hypothetical protein